MKQIFTLLSILMFVFTINAQYIYNDFDANQNETFTGWPNAPTIVANPDASGINTSANVAEWVRSADQWAHVYCLLDGKIDFTTGTTFELKLNSPVTCTVLFKLEDKNNGAIFTELSTTVTTIDEWIQLNFDFTGAQSNTYDKIVIFFDFANPVDNTFYFDDVEGPEYNNDPPPTATLTLPVTFDDPEAEYDLIDFGGNLSEIIVDPDDADNNIVKTIKTETAELWAGTTVGGTLGFVDPIPFTIDSTLMGLVVWSPDADIPVRLKVEDATNGGITCETEAMTTVAMAWDTLVFDFNNPAPGTPALNLNNNYNKASVFFNFGTTGADAGEKTYYWDYMYFAGAPEPKPLMEADVQDNFEDDGWGTIEEWFFQDPDLVELPTTTDPDDQNNTVADYYRSGGFQWTNAQTILEHRMDLTERNKFELDVYMPSSNDYSGDLNPTAAIKLQNSKLGGHAWTTQTEVLITVDEFDQWVTLLFDFSAIADSVNYDQIVIQLGGEGHWVSAQFYFDNLYLKHVPFLTVMTPNGGEEIEQNSSHMIEWDYNYWDGDINIELMMGNDDPEPLGIDIAASDSVFEWNVFPDQEPGEDYRIILTSVDGYATDTSDAYFTIVEVDGVQANFEADQLVVATSDSVFFTDSSSGDPDTWEWFFEGGTPETFNGQNPPPITYENAGIFDVTLTVYNGSDQDVMLKEEYITVGVPPTAGFEASETQILVGEMIDFANLSNGEGNTYEWYFEEGEPLSSTDENPSAIKYNEVGQFDVMLIASNIFGDDTLTMTDYITVGTVGLETNKMHEFQIYPNPATDQLKIKLNNEGTFDIHLRSINGQHISFLTDQSGLVKFNTTGFESGVYVISIFDDKNSLISIRKIIIHN